MGSGIFTQDGKQWRHSRELLRPQFMSNRLNNFERIKDAVNQLISCIPENREVDLQPLFFRLTFQTTLFLLFGQHVSSMNTETIADREREFADAFNLGQEYLAQRGRLGNFYWLLKGRKFRKACSTCHELWMMLFKKRWTRPRGMSKTRRNRTYLLMHSSRRPETPKS